MILYHGTNTDIEKINLQMCRPFKDFGKGFYLTSIKEQAERMAKRVSKIYGNNPILNVYELPDDFSENKELSIKDFGARTSESWARFVMNNRSKKFADIKSKECNLDCKYDIVIGPIANDDMVVLFNLYTNHFISFESLLKEMTFRDLTNQYSFHTERAVKLLAKIGVENVE